MVRRRLSRATNGGVALIHLSMCVLSLFNYRILIQEKFTQLFLLPHLNNELLKTEEFSRVKMNEFNSRLTSLQIVADLVVPDILQGIESQGGPYVDAIAGWTVIEQTTETND